MRKQCYLVLLLLALTGCTATYDLTINENGFYEELTINATRVGENEVLVDYPYTAHYDSQGNDENPLIKVEGVSYYNSEVKLENNLKVLKYYYQFNQNDFKRSNIISTSFDTLILKKYDYDEDGEKDYMLLSTSNDFTRFDVNEQLESVTVNIHCQYKIISSNADQVEGNVHTWYLTRNDLKAINMVYDPEVVVDDRSFWEKLKAGEYVNVFTLSIVLFIIGLIIYWFLKKKGELRDKI